MLIHISLDLNNFGHKVFIFYIKGEDLAHSHTRAHACLHMPICTPSPLAFSPSQFCLHHWVAFAAEYKGIIHCWAQFSLPFLYICLVFYLMVTSFFQMIYQIHIIFFTFVLFTQISAFDTYLALFILVCGFIPFLLLNH